VNVRDGHTAAVNLWRAYVRSMAGHASATGARASELTDATRLPPRTIRYALRDLESNELVDSRISFADARKRIYFLSDAISQPSESVD